MRFTITALGSAGGRTVGQVVSDIVRYLEPRLPERTGPARPAPAVPSGDGPSSYYADRGTEPGRWLGYSAREAGLIGEVDSADFARVLAGRDPRTGARLLTASGSAGRRPTLGAGQQTRIGPDDEPLYGVDDVAAALKVTTREAESLIVAGERRATRAIVDLLSRLSTRSASEPEGSYLVPLIDLDGSRWVTGAELDRCEHARAVGVSPDRIAACGEPGDQLSVAEAARLAGVTNRYIRYMCRAWEDHGGEIEAALAEDRTVDRSYVVAYRGTKWQWIITRRELVAFLQRRTAPAVRVGFDLTLTTEKSLGVLALLGDDRTRKAVLDAIQSGNDIGLDYLELNASGARAKGKPVLVRGLTIASFRHLTSRALDPFPHHHNIIANAVVDEHGDRRALDARGLYTHAQAASALGTAQMRHQLTRTLGVSWRRGRSGSWEIDGISDDVLREFSRRRSEIEDAVAELEAEIGRRSTLDEVQAVITGTRPAKEHVDPATLVAGWWERAHRHGLTPDALRACVGRPLSAPAVNEPRLLNQLASPTDGLCAGHSLFTRSDVLVALTNIDHEGHGPLIVDAAEMERLADAFLASHHVVQLDTSGTRDALGREDLYTTREILAVQQRIADRYRAGADAHAAVVRERPIGQALGSQPQLTDEQKNLVRSFCTSGRVIQCAIGRAGAGKTTTMRAAAHAWRAAGYEVLGTAVKGEAARHLAVGAGIATETVAWYLARVEHPPMGARTVVVVDEASTLSDRDLDALLHLAQRTGATVRLVGDPDQHGAVAAGGMFAYLCRTDPDDTPELSITHRVQDPADRDAARLLRRGRTREALARLADAGHLHLADNDLDLYLGMLGQWWEAHQQGSAHPMVDRRHHTRRVLNRLARQLRKANGELGDTEITTTGDRAFAVGDRVVARMAARHLHLPHDPNGYIRNGAAGTVVAVRPGDDPAGDAIDVAFDDVGVITVPRGFFDEHDGPGGRRDVGIDHAYAVTSYAVQGATFDVSTSRIDEGATRSEAYVDITRGRHANHLFLTQATDPLDGEHLPKAPDPDVRDSVADRLRRSGPERVAVELKTAEPSMAAARLAAHRQPVAWTDRFPDQTDLPAHVRRRRADAFRAVLVYRARWKPNPGIGAEWEWAVGPIPIDPAARAEHERAVETLDRHANAIAIDELQRRGLSAEWAAENLRFAMGAGVPVDELPALAQICQELRGHHGAGTETVGCSSADAPGLATEALSRFSYHRWLAASGTTHRPGQDELARTGSGRS